MKIDYAEKAKAVSLVAHGRDFDGDEQKWRDAYFHLLQWKMTWSLCYELDMNWSRKNGTFVRVVVKPDIAERLKEDMEEYGYRNISVDNITIELVSPRFDETVDEYYFDW